MFPNGIEHYLFGGVMIGVGVSLIFLLTGISPGTSTFFASTWSYISSSAFFTKYKDSRDWRVLFTLSIVAGAAIYAAVFGAWFTTEVQWWRLFLGGLLVGFGTRWSRGCTSGHGICGLASFSLSSLLAVVTFLLVAIGTALLVQSLGVFP